MRQSFVYALTDPDTNEIRYLGHSMYPSRRHRWHIDQARRNDRATHKARWIGKLLDAKKKPCLSIVDTALEGQVGERKRWWIASLRLQGVLLTNETVGGDGDWPGRRGHGGGTKPGQGWNKGLTIADPRVARSAKAWFAPGHVPWNKGLTKGTDVRVATYTERCSQSLRGTIPWNKGLTKDTHPSLMVVSQKNGSRKGWTAGLTKATDSRMCTLAESISRATRSRKRDAFGRFVPCKA